MKNIILNCWIREIGKKKDGENNIQLMRTIFFYLYNENNRIILTWEPFRWDSGGEQQYMAQNHPENFEF